MSSNYFRLIQNRKSAQKCRLKKKAEFSQLREDVTALKIENKELKDKLNEATMRLYQKIEENSQLQKSLESIKLQQTLSIYQQQSSPAIHN